MSHGHKNRAPWLMLWLEINRGSRCINWCYLSSIWCCGGMVADMWTTFDGGFLEFVWTVEACDQCGWLSPSQECNASIAGRLVQWNTFPYHRWDICRLHLRVSYYDMPWDIHVECGLLQQHSLKHQFQFQRIVGDRVRRVPMLSMNDVLMPQMISIMTRPTQIWLFHRPWVLG